MGDVDDPLFSVTRWLQRVFQFHVRLRGRRIATEIDSVAVSMGRDVAERQSMVLHPLCAQ